MGCHRHPMLFSWNHYYLSRQDVLAAYRFPTDIGYRLIYCTPNCWHDMMTRSAFQTCSPVDNFGTVVGENPTPYGILALWAVNGLSIVYWESIHAISVTRNAQITINLQLLTWFYLFITSH